MDTQAQQAQSMLTDFDGDLADVEEFLMDNDFEVEIQNEKIDTPGGVKILQFLSFEDGSVLDESLQNPYDTEAELKQDLEGVDSLDLDDDDEMDLSANVRDHDEIFAERAASDAQLPGSAKSLDDEDELEVGEDLGHDSFSH